MISDPLSRSVDITTAAIKSRPTANWILAFSGGKDSSAALKVFLAAYIRSKSQLNSVIIIYCDTGVENPILDIYVKSMLRSFDTEFHETKLPFTTRLLKAPLQDRFFVRIIGRGYPPPTNSFCWCTKELRIKPVSAFIKSQDPANTILVLGLRKSGSMQRDRSIARIPDLYWQKQREGQGDYDLFLPIVELDVPQVWDALFWLPTPRSIDARNLEDLYRGASGECPMIKSPVAPPCASGRFGCWTCTVVRRDKSAMALIRSGRIELSPFLEFRNWLATFRNDPAQRWPVRRSGGAGLGPFTSTPDKRYSE